MMRFTFRAAIFAISGVFLLPPIGASVKIHRLIKDIVGGGMANHRWGSMLLQLLSHLATPLGLDIAVVVVFVGLLLACALN